MDKTLRNDLSESIKNIPFYFFRDFSASREPKAVSKTRISREAAKARRGKHLVYPDDPNACFVTFHTISRSNV